MKRYSQHIITLLLSMLFIVLAAGTYFNPSIWLSVATLNAFLATMAVFYYFGTSKSREEKCSTQQLTELNDNNLLLKQQLDELENTASAYKALNETLEQWRNNPPDLSSGQVIDARLDALGSYLTDIGSMVDATSLFGELRDLDEAKSLIELLKRQVTVPFQDYLYNQSDVVSNESSHAILAYILQSFMELYDAIDSYKSFNAREEQSLNVKIIKQELDITQAKAMAKKATGDPLETPKWLRVLCDCMRNWGISEDDNIIITGYKMKN